MPLRPEIDRLAPYRPGGRLAGTEVVNLAANENPWGPSPRVLSAMADISDVGRYPQMQPEELVGRLAALHGLDPECIVLGTGSGHLIKLLAEVLVGPGDRVLVPQPGFSLYRHAVDLMGGTPEGVPVRGDASDADAYAARSEGAAVTFLCRPHNPLGGSLDLAALARIAAATGDRGLLAVDEAYIEYAGIPSAFALLRQRLPVAVLRTFSKAYGLAALRLGWLAAPPEVAAAVRKASEPFPINAVAARAALAALEDDAHVASVVARTVEGRAHLGKALESKGFLVHPSDANFLLVDVGDAAGRLHAHLLAQGILVRKADSFGLPQSLRITVGTEEENRRLVAAVEAFI